MVKTITGELDSMAMEITAVTETTVVTAIMEEEGATEMEFQITNKKIRPIILSAHKTLFFVLNTGPINHSLRKAADLQLNSTRLLNFNS